MSAWLRHCRPGKLWTCRRHLALAGLAVGLALSPASVNAQNVTNLTFGEMKFGVLANHLFQPGDRFTAGNFFRGAVNDREIVNSKSDRKRLGSHILFRGSLELGYWITPRIEISGYIGHVSNAGFARYNQSINDV